MSIKGGAGLSGQALERIVGLHGLVRRCRSFALCIVVGWIGGVD